MHSNSNSQQPLPTHNAAADFVGLEKLKKQLSEQLQKFEQWASEGHYYMFGPMKSHYDWWTFPNDLPSTRFRLGYTVYEKEVKQLLADHHYVNQLRRAIVLMMESWGWDAIKKEWIEKRGEGQSWKSWDVRLRKMGQCIRVFGFDDLYESANEMVRQMWLKGIHFDTNSSDLRGKWPFCTKKEAAARPQQGTSSSTIASSQ